VQRSAAFSSVCNLLKMERETGFEPATSSLGIQTYVGSKSLARFCCEFLNLQRLAESAFPKVVAPNEAQSRQVLSLSRLKATFKNIFMQPEGSQQFQLGSFNSGAHKEI
jgi:hypothetical protein